MMIIDSQPQCATDARLFLMSTGSGRDDALRCIFDVYAQASIHIVLQVVCLYFMQLPVV
jgi:hypothetical protein